MDQLSVLGYFSTVFSIVFSTRGSVFSIVFSTRDSFVYLLLVTFG